MMAWLLWCCHNGAHASTQVKPCHQHQPNHKQTTPNPPTALQAPEKPLQFAGGLAALLLLPAISKRTHQHQ
jgi:hypothetical protein